MFMKKTLFTVLITIIASLSALNADTLSIKGGEMDLSSSIQASYSDNGRLLMDGRFFMIPQDQYEWTPFLNGEEISRQEFYRLTGQENLLNISQKAEKKTRFMNVTGYSLLAIGSAFTATTVILYATGNEFITENIYPFMASGLGTIILSFPFMSYESKDGVNIMAAIQIANDYNHGVF